MKYIFIKKNKTNLLIYQLKIEKNKKKIKQTNFLQMIVIILKVINFLTLINYKVKKKKKYFFSYSY